MEEFNISIYLWGVFGSVATEIVSIADTFSKRIRPSRYKDFEYWIIRVIVAISAGFIPIMYGVNEPVLAIHLGVSAPLIFDNIIPNNAIDKGKKQR